MVLLGLICLAQQQQQRTKVINKPGHVTHIDYNGKSYNWEKVSNECYGCASFYFKVFRSSTKTNDEYYYYYICFFSNSYDYSGYLKSTYITEVSISSKSETGEFEQVDYSEYVLVPPKFGIFDGVYIAFVYQSIYSDEEIKISWKDILVY